jgi:dihydroneopterin aldolase
MPSPLEQALQGILMETKRETMHQTFTAFVINEVLTHKRPLADALEYTRSYLLTRARAEGKNVTLIAELADTAEVYALARFEEMRNIIFWAYPDGRASA